MIKDTAIFVNVYYVPTRNEMKFSFKMLHEKGRMYRIIGEYIL